MGTITRGFANKVTADGVSSLDSTVITGATAETSIAGGDSILLFDDSASALRKMTRTNFVAGIGATAGQVIQVVSATDSTQRDTTSSTFVTASNTLSVAITPSSASNKILILVSSALRAQGDNNAFVTVFRGATDLGAASNKGFSCSKDGGVGVDESIGFNFLDSPNTTSSTTYEVRIRILSGSTLNFNVQNIKASITLMEIKG